MTVELIDSYFREQVELSDKKLAEMKERYKPEANYFFNDFLELSKFNISRAVLLMFRDFWEEIKLNLYDEVDPEELKKHTELRMKSLDPEDLLQDLNNFKLAWEAFKHEKEN